MLEKTDEAGEIGDRPGGSMDRGFGGSRRPAMEPPWSPGGPSPARASRLGVDRSRSRRPGVLEEGSAWLLGPWSGGSPGPAPCPVRSIPGPLWTSWPSPLTRSGPVLAREEPAREGSRHFTSRSRPGRPRPAGGTAPPRPRRRTSCDRASAAEGARRPTRCRCKGHRGGSSAPSPGAAPRSGRAGPRRPRIGRGPPGRRIRGRRGPRGGRIPGS
jgi:hypothetical protein